MRLAKLFQVGTERGGAGSVGLTATAAFTVCADGPPLRDGRLQLFGPSISVRSENVSKAFCIVELRFLKFRLISRIYRPKVGSRENHCPSLGSTTSAIPLGGLWSPASNGEAGSARGRKNYSEHTASSLGA